MASWDVGWSWRLTGALSREFLSSCGAEGVKEVKEHGAPGLSALATGVIRAVGNVGARWMLDLCGGIVE